MINLDSPKFDYVDFSFECVKCKKLLSTFKFFHENGECNFLKPWMVDEFSSLCSCNITWVFSKESGYSYKAQAYKSNCCGGNGILNGLCFKINNIKFYYLKNFNIAGEIVREDNSSLDVDYPLIKLKKGFMDSKYGDSVSIEDIINSLPEGSEVEISIKYNRGF